MDNLISLMEVLNSRQNLILCGHIMPDGDSLGSMLALGKVLEGAGKNVIMASFDPVPDNLTFLPGVDKIHTGDREFEEQYDTFVMLDCSSPDRLGPYAKLLNRDLLTVNIDHHPGNTIRAGYTYVDPAAAATGEIIYDMLIHSGCNISSEVAACLYTAIITDTGSFRYENTTPATHRRVAELMECGIEPAKLTELIYDQKSMPAILLLRAALQTLEFSKCRRVAWISVFRKTLEEVNARDEQAEGIINYPRSIKGVEVAILFRETEPGVFKVGFRSKGEVDVQCLASKFGGGGHVRASGCIVRGEFRDICKQVVNAAVNAVENKDGC